ncbi:hypothetical protein FB45DRAFT_17131 [Roridomyces roridus]|uniref:F-box domain-containing protein n=1 Tax=Roridomyces roridus TaxID=1738132 RepID=A0AAD7G269_9AGAR|nr:hypothetical protein FB45DRAFT_17131 [Roridomyces roridus]
MLFQSPADRVLQIPELLALVFQFLDPESQCAGLLVCKRWSEIALDALWRVVDDLHRLFSILGPLHQPEDHAGADVPYAFVSAPNADDWARFEKYSRRIRRLMYNSESVPRLSPTVFEDLARTRTSLNLAPNVNMLSWLAPLRWSVMFMHPNVKHLVLHLPEDFVTMESPSTYVRDIVTRMSNLTCLDLRTNIPMHDIEDSMGLLLQSLVKLRKVVLPRFAFTTRIAEIVAELEDLGCVEFQYWPEQGCGDPGDTMAFKPTLKLGCFPSLWYLAATITIDCATDFMSSSLAPTNLTSLYVDSRLVETPESVNRLLTVLAENCQLLESLSIITLIDESMPFQSLDDVPSTERINASTLGPLQRFPNLTIFEFIHQNPLDMTNFEDMARSWPSLRKLILNNEPLISDRPPSLTLKSLLPFARYCPELEHLGVFIDATTGDLPASYPPDFFPRPFAKLVHLSMGISHITEPGPVALFLSHLCPLNVKIDYGVTWDTHWLQPPILSAIFDRCSAWDKVAELLPLLTKLRMEERERTRLLVTEVKDLRMRSDVLMGNVSERGRDSCIIS